MAGVEHAQDVEGATPIPEAQTAHYARVFKAIIDGRVVPFIGARAFAFSPEGSVEKVAFDPDGKILISGSRDDVAAVERQPPCDLAVVNAANEVKGAFASRDSAPA